MILILDTYKTLKRHIEDTVSNLFNKPGRTLTPLKGKKIADTYAYSNNRK